MDDLDVELQLHEGEKVVRGAAALTSLASLLKLELVGGLSSKIPPHRHLLLQAIAVEPICILDERIKVNHVKKNIKNMFVHYLGLS